MCVKIRESELSKIVPLECPYRIVVLSLVQMMNSLTRGIHTSLQWQNVSRQEFMAVDEQVFFQLFNNNYTSGRDI
jgi:hypothetical protein